MSKKAMKSPPRYVFSYKSILRRTFHGPSTSTLETEDIQSLIDHSVKDNIAKQILQTFFNQFKEE